MAGKKRRPNATGRGDIQQFIKLDYRMVLHPAWFGLKGNSIKVLLFISTRFNGGNNGQIFVSYGDITAGTQLSRQAISHALKQLGRHGFLKIKARGQWQGRKANEYELTFKHMGNESTRKLPSNEWRYFNEKQECVLIPDHITQQKSANETN